MSLAKRLALGVVLGYLGIDSRINTNVSVLQGRAGLCLPTTLSLLHVHRFKPAHTCTHTIYPLAGAVPLSPLGPPGSPHFSPLPTNCSLHPSTVIPNSKAQPFCQPRPLQVRALWGPFPIERKKERKREENQKERGKQKNEIGPKGQWCLELSHCITMNMDSIKLRSAC